MFLKSLFSKNYNRIGKNTAIIALSFMKTEDVQKVSNIKNDVFSILRKGDISSFSDRIDGLAKSQDLNPIALRLFLGELAECVQDIKKPKKISDFLDGVDQAIRLVSV